MTGRLLPEPDELYSFLGHAFAFSDGRRPEVVNGPDHVEAEALELLRRLVPAANSPGQGDGLDALFGVLWELAGGDWNDAQQLLSRIGRPRREHVLAGIANALAALAEKAALAELPDTPRRQLARRRRGLARRGTLHGAAPKPMDNSDAGSNSKQPPITAVHFNPRSVTTILSELDALPGLRLVRNQVRGLTARLEVGRARRAAGLPAAGRPPLHAAFIGPPGTGKTMVARLLAELYGAMGLLQKNLFVEAGRSSLVGIYTGHTSVRVGDTVARAMGGVLFIDEAYSLVGDTFADEAVAELLRLMENHRSELVVVFAGYRNEMEAFLQTNPGLASRVGTRLDFESYDDDELWDIVELLALEAGYLIADDARPRVKDVLTAQRASEHFGNGRAARTLLEAMISNHALRLYEAGDLSEDALVVLTAADVPRVLGVTGVERPAAGYL